MDMAVEIGLCDFDRQRERMRVGDQEYAFTLIAHPCKEVRRLRQESNSMPVGPCQVADVKLKRFAPVIDAIPRETPLDGPVMAE